ncbi:MAG: hypothetical protein H6817_01365 [Phycisphaerales bacterium]|nr:hypothetical protein [Phycisphaerales bacterium]
MKSSEQPPVGNGLNLPRAYANEPDIGYYDDPPLDYPERQWRWYTRHVRPQRFADRDRTLRYGTDPPFTPYGPSNSYGYGWYGYGAFGGEGAMAEGNIQGRYDERRFDEWQEHHDKGREAYAAAMAEGVDAFRNADYSAAVGAFVRAAELNQGDPASRLLGTYALVAIGNYDDAVLMLRRAIQLQSRLIYLPLSIREEYGPKIDFDAHLQKLRQATEDAKDDAGRWMLLAFYEHFTGNREAASEAITKANEQAPRDPLIQDLHRAIRLLTPSQ